MLFDLQVFVAGCLGWSFRVCVGGYFHVCFA